MNILIPHSWLLEHLSTKTSAKQIQEYLSLCGPSVERIYQIENEDVYDIEITTNRVDSMSVRGVAREAVVILKQFGIEATLKKLTLINESELKISNELPLPKIVDQNNLCKRKIGIILANVQKTATPNWMAKRLRQIGVSVHESAIDITNYVTHEIGHPIHAFDYDKIMQTGGEIIVTEAKAGKKFITLDNESYSTIGGEIVFENAKGEIIDLPAIKGTANTSVDNNTKNILLWIENLPAKKVRHASMGHAIRTTAAQLSEKNVDPHLAKDTLLKAVELYQQLCQADIASQIYDDFSQKRENKIIKLSENKIKEYLGISLQSTKVKQILNDLDCQVKEKKLKNHYILEVVPPTFRPDLAISADLIEEIARIYGYHNLPSTLMPTAIPLDKPKNTNFHLEEKIKKLLANIGWQEVYSYSMVSEEIALQSGYKISTHLKLQNPLTQDRVYLRQTLIPSLKEVLLNNQLEDNLSVFELANIYRPVENDLPNEELILALVSKKPYRQVKGALDLLFSALYFNEADLVYSQDDHLATINYQGKLLGKIAYQNKITAIELYWQVIVQCAGNHPHYQALPKTALIIEDLTFAFSGKTQLDAMAKDIKNIDQQIMAIDLKDHYQDRFTYSLTYHNQHKNLTSKDIEPIRKKIVELVLNKYQGKLIGQL